MQRSEKGEVIRLRRDVARARAAVCTLRESLIQALGDWLCGGGPAPSIRDIEALAALCEAQDKAEARYARCIAALAQDVVAHAASTRAERR